MQPNRHRLMTYRGKIIYYRQAPDGTIIYLTDNPDGTEAESADLEEAMERIEKAERR